jgi:hypothetical protein
MQRPLEVFEHKGHKIAIYPDHDPQSPVDWDHLGTITYMKGARTVLGMEAVDSDDIVTILQRPDIISLNVYAYVHSGIVLKTSPFSDPWDSGQSGIIYTTEKQALKAFDRKRMTPALRKKVHQLLQAEVKTFGEYLNGEVYGYEISNPAGEVIDSLWGIYDYDYAKSEAMAAAKNMLGR